MDTGPVIVLALAAATLIAASIAAVYQFRTSGESHETTRLQHQATQLQREANVEAQETTRLARESFGSGNRTAVVGTHSTALLAFDVDPDRTLRKAYP